jgi:hypothetical protein
MTHVIQLPKYKRMHKLYFALASGAGSLFGWLLSSDATRSGSDPHYSFMFSPLAYGAYVAAVIGVAALTGGLFSLRLSRRIIVPLVEEDLRRIMEISSNPNHMRADKHQLLAPYNKMWVQVAGKVADVGEPSGWSRRLEVQTCVPRLIAYAYFFNKGVLSRYLGVLPRGTRVTVVGKVKRIEEGGITLVRCKTVQREEWIIG